MRDSRFDGEGRFPDPGLGKIPADAFGGTGRSSFGQADEGDDVFSLKQLFGTLWKWAWVVLLVVVLLTGTVVGYSLVQTPQYEASTTILIGQQSGITTAPAPLLDLTPTMAEAIISRPVAEEVIERENLETTPGGLLAAMSAEPLPDTLFIRVAYSDSDPERALGVARAVGDVFSDQISAATPQNSSLTATVWETAQVSTVPVSPDPLTRGLWAFVFGGILGVALAFLLEYLDDRWQSPEEAEMVSGVPTLGLIPEFEVSPEAGRPAVQAPRQVQGRERG